MYRIPAYETMRDLEMEQLEAMQNAVEFGLPQGEQGNAQTGTMGPAEGDDQGLNGPPDADEMTTFGSDGDDDDHGLNWPPDDDEDAMDSWDGLDEYDDEDIMDEEATRTQLVADQAQEENERRLAAEESAATAFELATQDREAQNDKDGSAESSAGTPGAASQVQVAATEGKGSLPSEGVHQHADIVAPPASASGAADTGAAESTGASVDDQARGPDGDELGEHGVAEPAEAHEASGDQSHAPCSTPAPVAADDPEHAPRPSLTWEGVRRGGVPWPADWVVEEIGDRYVLLVVRLMQAASASADGQAKFQDVFRKVGPADRKVYEHNVFTSEAARFALRKLKTAAKEGKCSQAVKQFADAIETVSDTVFMHTDAVLAGYRRLLEPQDNAPAADGASIDMPDHGPRSSGTREGGDAGSEPAATGAATPAQEPRGRAASGKAAPTAVVKVEFPPLDLDIVPVEDGAACYRLKDTGALDGVVEWCISNLYPAIRPVYAQVDSPEIWRGLALLHLEEWLRCGAARVRHMLHGPGGPRVAGRMFCGWVRTRSAITFSMSDSGDLNCLLVDVWRAGACEAYCRLFGSWPRGAIKTTKDNLSYYLRRIGWMAGRAFQSVDIQDPVAVYRLAQDFVALGAALLGVAGVELGDRDRWRLLFDDATPPELQRCYGGPSERLCSCLWIAQLRRGLLPRRQELRGADGGFDRAKVEAAWTPFYEVQSANVRDARSACDARNSRAARDARVEKIPDIGNPELEKTEG